MSHEIFVPALPEARRRFLAAWFATCHDLTADAACDAMLDVAHTMLQLWRLANHSPDGQCQLDLGDQP
jgi:hypothetical protein